MVMLPLVVGLAPGAVASEGSDESVVPVVVVVPDAHLAGGDVVAVTVTGLPPSTDVRIFQCDYLGGGPYGENCVEPESWNATGPDGRVTVPVTLADEVFSYENSEPGHTTLCRADECRIFVAWDDGSGNLQEAYSDPLEFIGSPATVNVRPAADLRDGQRVRVTGTAVGASGQRVMVWQEACPTIRGYPECYGALPAISTKVRKDGTFSVSFRVRRELADGQDCMTWGYWFGPCQIWVRVLDLQGQPDHSFGHPSASLSFTVEPPANDTPATSFRLGHRTISVRTIGAAPLPEAPCVPAPGQQAVEATPAYTTWYSFRGTGRKVTLSTAGSIDGGGQPLTTLLGVYRARSMAPVACASLEGGAQDSLTIRTRAGVRYLVQVGGRWDNDPAELPNWSDGNWWVYGKVVVTRR